MAYVKIENNIVVQKQPNNQEGFIKVDDSIICGMVHNGDASYAKSSFSNPAPDLHGYLPKYRNKRVYEGITVNGISIETDDKTQQRLVAIRILAKENPEYTVKWKSSGVFYDLGANTIIELADAVRAHIQKCFDAESAIANNLYDTKEELEAAFDEKYEA